MLASRQASLAFDAPNSDCNVLSTSLTRESVGGGKFIALLSSPQFNYALLKSSWSCHPPFVPFYFLTNRRAVNLKSFSKR
jgi:hypothetical protein